MAKGNFKKCMSYIFPWEGGYVNHPSDPGGETNYGISKRSYPNVNIRALTKAQAERIYERDYWNPIQGDSLPMGVDLSVLDGSINSGVRQSVKWLQRAVGTKADGVVGINTLNAVSSRKSSDIVKAYFKNRLSMLQSLKTWKTFGKGWLNRITSIEASALRMTGVSLSVQADKAGKESAAHKKEAAAGGAIGVGGGFGFEQIDMPTVLITIIFIAGFLYAARSMWESHIDSTRQKTIKKEAQ